MLDTLCNQSTLFLIVLWPLDLLDGAVFIETRGYETLCRERLQTGDPSHGPRLQEMRIFVSGSGVPC
jgi:hypothetical protein